MTLATPNSGAAAAPCGRDPGSGRDLAVELRRDTPGLRVLYMSGYTSDEVVARGVHEASADFLQKPFTPAILARRVREVLNSAPRPWPAEGSPVS